MQRSHSNSSGSSSDDDLEAHFNARFNKTPTTVYGGGGGSSSHQQTPTNSPPISPPSKKPRGRPPGSKNKPKPPLVITQDNEQAMKPVIIEVAAGTDVVEAVIQFAVRSASCLTVLSGSGTIAVTTLHYPLCRSPPFTLHGPFSLMSLSGTFLYPPSPPPPPPPTPLSLPLGSSANAANLVEPPASGLSFGITLAGMQGQIFGGIVGGKVIAGGDGVKVAVTLFKNPELHRAGGVILEPDDDDGDNNGSGNSGGNDGGNGGGDGGGDGGAASGGGGGSENVSGFNVHNPMPLNLAHSDPNFMPWNQSRSPNY